MAAAVSATMLAGCGAGLATSPSSGLAPDRCANPNDPTTSEPCPAATSWPPSITNVTTPPSIGPVGSVASVPSNDIVVYEGKRPNDPRLVEKIGKAEEQQLLRKVFPKFLSDPGQCSGASTSLQDARARGDIVSRVLSVATGSFTATNATQKLYLVFVGECGATHADNFGSNMLVVTEANAVRARISIAGGTSIYSLVDLEGDGRSEVVLTSGFANQGGLVEAASLVRVEPSGLVTLRDFGEVMESNCASIDDTKASEVSVIRALTKVGSSPEFRVEKRTERCD